MRIALDCRMKHGVATVVRGIVPHIASRVEKLYAMGDPKLFSAWWPADTRPLFVKFTAPVYGWREQVEFPLDAIRDCHLLHVPHFNVPVRQMPFPLVVTINDIAHLAGVLPMSWSHRQAAKLYLRHAAWRARHVITLSIFSKEEIVTKLHVDPERVTVIPCAVDHSMFQPADVARIQEVLQRLKIQSPYLMISGSVRPHKNVGRVLNAFNELKTRYSIPHQLVIVGEREGFRLRYDLPTLPDDVNRDVVFTGYVSDSDLAALYSGAAVFIFASLYEGFGLPPLEAMACGAPVAVSRAASLPEVVGGAGEYFDPHSVDDIVHAVLSFIEDEEKRQSARIASLERARLFQWQHSAEAYMRVYDHVMMACP